MKKRSSSDSDKPGVKKVKLGKLLPIQVDTPPAFFPQRTQFLNVIKDKLVENGYDGSRAIEIEAKLAKENSKHTYPMSIRRIVKDIITKKLDHDEVIDEEPMYRRELEKLIVDMKELEKAGYITEIPNSNNTAEKDESNQDSQKICARCKTKFLMDKPGTCKFHLLRRQYDMNIKKLSPLFPCCNEPLDQSSGCEVRKFHVFKLDTPEELHTELPFIKTPKSQNKDILFAVGLDCEMGWTDHGFELIRLTVMDYSTRKVVLDRLVKPKGKILDLNTRFSGVKDMEDGTIIDGKKYPALSFEEMYTELFKLISDKTVLIGHGLVNDLNVLRLIHHRVVDTAVLFPRSRTRTFSLKDLSWDYLSRVIQTGEHSSEEDSLAAIDIVRKDIKQRVK